MLITLANCDPPRPDRFVSELFCVTAVRLLGRHMPSKRRYHQAFATTWKERHLRRPVLFELVRMDLSTQDLAWVCEPEGLSPCCRHAVAPSMNRRKANASASSSSSS